MGTVAARTSGGLRRRATNPPYELKKQMNRINRIFQDLQD
jgi:hypothetical protein